MERKRINGQKYAWNVIRAYLTPFSHLYYKTGINGEKEILFCPGYDPLFLVVFKPKDTHDGNDDGPVNTNIKSSNREIMLHQ